MERDYVALIQKSIIPNPVAGVRRVAAVYIL
jgi:hypothetical protein